MEKDKLKKLLDRLNVLKSLLALALKLLSLIKLRDIIAEEPTERRIVLKELGEAMAHFEGFYRTDYITLAQKNHNPLNLRWSKFMTHSVNNFAVFLNDEMGWKGCLYDLCKKCKGETVTKLTAESSLKDLIYTWSATDQAPYLNYVCQKLKVSKDFKLKGFILETYC